jgi:hypothetical protein
VRLQAQLPPQHCGITWPPRDEVKLLGKIVVKSPSVFPLAHHLQGIMNLLFTCLIIAQFIVVSAHDWIDIPGVACGSQVQAVIGRRKLAWATVINCLFPRFTVALAIRFFHAPGPDYALRYWLVYTGITVGSALQPNIGSFMEKCTLERDLSCPRAAVIAVQTCSIFAFMRSS